MRVAILTTFADFDRSYSLVGVVLEQCAMLKENGIEFGVFVNQNSRCEGEEWLVEHIHHEVPTGLLEEDIINKEVCAATEDFLQTSVLPNYDVVITHDWMFTTWNVSYNQAVRNVVENHPQVTWVHWVHSAPSERPARVRGPAGLRYQLCPYSLYVYLNEEDTLRYAESIGTTVDSVMTCYNPMDACTFLGVEDEKLASFIRSFRLWEHDLLQVYPFSMPRAESKGVPKLISLFGAWRKLGYNAKLVLVNAHCNDPVEKNLVHAYNEAARRDWGYQPFWTSSVEGWEYSVPNVAVRQLMLLSNLFVFPTHSEACSRVLQEASLAGCLVVGNEDFSPMREFLSNKTPWYRFSSARMKTTHPAGDNQYMMEVAKSLVPLLHHPVMKQKTHMLKLVSRETVWRDQLFPILQRAHQMSEVRS